MEKARALPSDSILAKTCDSVKLACSHRSNQANSHSRSSRKSERRHTRHGTKTRQNQKIYLGNPMNNPNEQHLDAIVHRAASSLRPAQIEQFRAMVAKVKATPIRYDPVTWEAVQNLPIDNPSR